jgi:hypothetical protein
MPTTRPPSGIVTAEIRPIPDPTVLTTQQLLREIATSREVVEAGIDGKIGRVESRFDAMDKAIELVRQQTDLFPNNVVDQVGKLERLHEERFRSIALQFVERDTRTDQTSRDSKVAVDAALQAAKEAVGEQNKSNALAIAKSEAAFTKQIDQIGALIMALQKGLDDKIDDMKERLQTIEGQKKGTDGTWSHIVTIGALVFAAVMAIAAVVALVSRH